MALLRLRRIVLSLPGFPHPNGHYGSEDLPMKRLFAVSGCFALCAAALHGAEVSADSTRGAQVFELQGCVRMPCAERRWPDDRPRSGPACGSGVHAGLLRRHDVEPCAGHVGRDEVAQCRRAPRWTNSRRPICSPFSIPCASSKQPGDAGRGKALFADAQVRRDATASRRRRFRTRNR